MSTLKYQLRMYQLRISSSFSFHQSHVFCLLTDTENNGINLLCRISKWNSQPTITNRQVSLIDVGLLDHADILLLQPINNVLNTNQ